MLKCVALTRLPDFVSEPENPSLGEVVLFTVVVGVRKNRWSACRPRLRNARFVLELSEPLYQGDLK